MLNIVKLGAGLLLLIVANIAIGSINAIVNKEWNKDKFWKGIVKGVIVIAAFAAVYFAGWLNPNLVVMEVNDEEMTMMMAVHAILVAGFGCYAVKVILKLKEVVLPSKVETKVELPKIPLTSQTTSAAEPQGNEGGDVPTDSGAESS